VLFSPMSKISVRSAFIAWKWIENACHFQKHYRRLRKVLGNLKNVISQPSVEKSFRRPSQA